MKFNNKYEDIYGNMVDLTEEELKWFLWYSCKIPNA